MDISVTFNVAVVISLGVGLALKFLKDRLGKKKNLRKKALLSELQTIIMTVLNGINIKSDNVPEIEAFNKIKEFITHAIESIF